MPLHPPGSLGHALVTREPPPPRSAVRRSAVQRSAACPAVFVAPPAAPCCSSPCLAACFAPCLGPQLLMCSTPCCSRVPGAAPAGDRGGACPPRRRLRQRVAPRLPRSAGRRRRAPSPSLREGPPKLLRPMRHCSPLHVPPPLPSLPPQAVQPLGLPSSPLPSEHLSLCVVMLPLLPRTHNNTLCRAPLARPHHSLTLSAPCHHLPVLHPPPAVCGRRPARLLRKFPCRRRMPPQRPDPPCVLEAQQGASLPTPSPPPLLGTL
jgi:hypothetical protein